MMTEVDECRSIGGMLHKGNPSTTKQSAPVPRCPQELLYDPTKLRSQVLAVGSRLLTD
jgi:hypothetical protein